MKVSPLVYLCLLEFCCWQPEEKFYVLPGNVLGQTHEFKDITSIFHITAGDGLFKQLSPV